MDNKGKVKSYMVRNWEGILAGLIGTALWTWGQSIFTSFWEFTKVLVNLNAVYSFILWIIFAVGVSAIVYAFLRLLRRIFAGKNLDVVIYDGLKLEEDKDETGFVKSARVGADLASEFKLTILAHNTNKYVYDCAVELENLEYQGASSNDQWIDALFGFDRKAMKWDVGYIPNEGKIDISINAIKKLEIAVAFKQGKMEISYLDGYSNRRYLMDGKYRITLRIDGKLSVNQTRKEMKPHWYKIEFEYPSTKSYLRLIEIKEYEPK